LPLDFFTPSRQRYEDVRSFLCVVEYTAVIMKVRGILFKFRSTASHGRKYVHDNTVTYAPDDGVISWPSSAQVTTACWTDELFI
jgi:hypothetical protein